MPTQIQTVLKAARDPKQAGDREWKSICPSHNDTNRSLSIREMPDGTVSIHCFAGCGWSDVVERMGLEAWMLFHASNEKGDPVKGKEFTLGGPGKKTLGPIVAVYNYTDANGNLLYQVTRHDPKDFRQRRPDGNGGWIWKKGEESVLYNLPNVIAARERGERIFLCEGEKDADNVCRLGLVATTNSGGAGKGKKWQRSHSLELKGTHVVLFPHNDEAGREHAANIANQLHSLGGRTQIVELPDLPINGDISDWLAAGGTADELEKIIAATLFWRPSQDPKSESYRQNFEIEKIEKVGQKSAIYHIYIFGCVVEMSVEDLNSFSLFTKKVMEISDRRPDFRNIRDWGPYLDMCLQERLVKLEAPEDANSDAVIWHSISRYMKLVDPDGGESALAEKRGPWHNEKYIYFHGPSLHLYLTRLGVRIEPTSLWDLLRRRGAINKPKRARDSQDKVHLIKAWLVEKASVTDEVEDCKEGE